MDYQENKTIIFCKSCHRKIHAKNLQFPDLAPNKPKIEKTAKKKKPAQQEQNEKPQEEQKPQMFEAPSELFKKQKASRDRVKHPRY